MTEVMGHYLLILIFQVTSTTILQIQYNTGFVGMIPLPQVSKSYDDDQMYRKIESQPPWYVVSMKNGLRTGSTYYELISMLSIYAQVC